MKSGVSKGEIKANLMIYFQADKNGVSSLERDRPEEVGFFLKLT
jgi:hypothetical protein